MATKVTEQVEIEFSDNMVNQSHDNANDDSDMELMDEYSSHSIDDALQESDDSVMIQ